MQAMTMTLDQLRATASAGGVVGVTLKGQGGGFFIEIDTRSGHGAVLTKARGSEPRRFGSPTPALVLLRELGIVVSKMDTTAWDPEQREMNQNSDNRAKALREAHAAAAYSKWLASSIQASIDDPRPNVSNDDVMAILDGDIAALPGTEAA